MSRHICCLSWPKVGLLLHAGELPGSHVVLLSIISSTWISIKNHVHAVLVHDFMTIQWFWCSSVILSWLVHVRAACYRKTSSSRPTCSPKWWKNPLESPTRAVGWCGHAAYAAHPLASIRHRSWRVTEWRHLFGDLRIPHLCCNLKCTLTVKPRWELWSSSKDGENIFGTSKLVLKYVEINLSIW